MFKKFESQKKFTSNKTSKYLKPEDYKKKREEKEKEEKNIQALNDMANLAIAMLNVNSSLELDKYPTLPNETVTQKIDRVSKLRNVNQTSKLQNTSIFNLTLSTLSDETLNNLINKTEEKDKNIFSFKLNQFFFSINSLKYNKENLLNSYLKYKYLFLRLKDIKNQNINRNFNLFRLLPFSTIFYNRYSNFISNSKINLFNDLFKYYFNNNLINYFNKLSDSKRKEFFQSFLKISSFRKIKRNLLFRTSGLERKIKKLNLFSKVLKTTLKQKVLAFKVKKMKMKKRKKTKENVKKGKYVKYIHYLFDKLDRQKDGKFYSSTYERFFYSLQRKYKLFNKLSDKDKFELFSTFLKYKTKKKNKNKKMILRLKLLERLINVEQNFDSLNQIYLKKSDLFFNKLNEKYNKDSINFFINLKKESKYLIISPRKAFYSFLSRQQRLRREKNRSKFPRKSYKYFIRRFAGIPFLYLFKLRRNALKLISNSISQYIKGKKKYSYITCKKTPKRNIFNGVFAKKKKLIKSKNISHIGYLKDKLQTKYATSYLNKKKLFKGKKKKKIILSNNFFYIKNIKVFVSSKDIKYFNFLYVNNILDNYSGLKLIPEMFIKEKEEKEDLKESLKQEALELKKKEKKKKMKKKLDKKTSNYKNKLEEKNRNKISNGDKKRIKLKLQSKDKKKYKDNLHLVHKDLFEELNNKILFIRFLRSRLSFSKKNLDCRARNIDYLYLKRFMFLGKMKSQFKDTYKLLKIFSNKYKGIYFKKKHKKRSINKYKVKQNIIKKKQIIKKKKMDRKKRVIKLKFLNNSIISMNYADKINYYINKLNDQHRHISFIINKFRANNLYINIIFYYPKPSLVEVVSNSNRDHFYMYWNVNSLYFKFIGFLIREGKRGKAEYIFNHSLYFIKEFTTNNPIFFFFQAIYNSQPMFEYIKHKKKFKTFVFPRITPLNKRLSLSMRNIAKNIRSKELLRKLKKNNKVDSSFLLYNLFVSYFFIKGKIKKDLKENLENAFQKRRFFKKGTRKNDFKYNKLLKFMSFRKMRGYHF